MLASFALATLAVAMTIHVLSEDTYSGDGRSRWTVYNAHAITVAAIATAVAATAVALAGVRRPSMTWVVSLVGVGAVLTNYAALAQMTN